MRVDAPHGPQALPLEKEVLLHAQLDLRANAKRRGEQQVERAADDAFGRVLDRHHGELHRARLAAAERVIDRARRLALDRAAEMLAYRLLAESPLGPEVGDADRFLQAAAGRDHLAEYGRDALRGKHTRILGDSSQYFNFPLRPVGRRAGLQRADALREAGAAVEQRRQLVVERIDLAAQLFDFVRHRREDSAPPARLSIGTARPASRREPGCPHPPACTPSLPWTCSACCGC